VPTFVGASREGFRPGKLLSKQLVLFVLAGFDCGAAGALTVANTLFIQTQVGKAELTALCSLRASRFLRAGQIFQRVRSLVCIRVPVKAKVNHELSADDGSGNTPQVYS